jgi:NHLM bacteriocin system ABC transporter ATP-binding protein
VELETYSTSEWLRQSTDWSDFDTFRVAVANWTGFSEKTLRASERERRLRRASTNRQMKDTALSELMGAMTTSFPVLDLHASTHANALLEACRAVGARDGIEFVPPAQWELDDGVRNPIGAICVASRVRSRRVALRGEWWRHDSGSFLCRFTHGSVPVAALRDAHGNYDLHNPATGARTRMSAQVAALLEPFGVVFYRPLPAVPITTRTLVRFVLTGMGGSLWNIASIAMVAGALGLFMPIAMGFVFDQVIPSNMRGQLGQVFIGLTIAALSAQTFELVRAFTVLRLEGRSATMMQAAVFDRLLQLPAPFFQRYTVGDLVQRVNGVSQVRQLLSSGTVTALLGGLTGMLNFILLFYFSPRLAFVAAGLAVIVCGVILYLSWITKRVQDQIQDVTGKLAGLVFQLVSGIAKLRVSGAEDRALAMWARRYVDKVRLEQRASMSNGLVVLITGMVPLLASIVTFGVVGAMIDTPGVLNVASFVAFNSALGAFLAAAMSTSNTVINAVQIVPLMRRASAILMEPPEVTADRPGPGRLTGRIEGRSLSFRYRPDTPQVLNDVTFYAEPGEFIAFVGQSGSGKSTTLRLLLGFEQPDTGAVYYDGQDLSTIDVAAVRRQMGVVLQSSRLMAGDVYTNIIGALPLTINDAWEAAEMAGFADDVRDMPMQMHTMISEGGSTLSGGQRQRLLIARALVHKPRIILFDEATSALDNRTQAVVTESLARMHATRIVIAHRLSTIQHADRVYVMEDGRIVEWGTPSELMANGGSFAKLAARQLT